MGDDFVVWKQHFIDQARGHIPFQKKFYKVSSQGGRGGEPSIKMVTPTEQLVERAKSSLSHPPSIYDPVTGVMQHSEGDHLTGKISLKRKYKKKSSSKKTHKKKKKSESSKKTKPEKKKNSKRQSKENKKSVKWW